LAAYGGKAITSLRHDAFVYSADDEFVERSAPFLEGGVQDGSAVLAILARSKWAGLREALGPIADQVEFIDRDGFYVRPATAIASFDACIEERLAAGAPYVRAIAETQFGPTAAEWRTWTTYEGIVNRALAEHPLWVICGYDARDCPDEMLDAAWRAHAHVLTDDYRPSACYEEPEQLVASLLPQHAALPGLRHLPACGDPAAVREALAAEMADAHVPGAAAMLMLVAANEVAANAWDHGGGPTAMRAGLVDHRFVFEISDAGPGLDDPLAGYMPPRPANGRGRGLWIARQLVSRVDLLAAEPGLTVRLWL
jgi:anti-sigma regulatory factor (Ser/Thr protein kinase)